MATCLREEDNLFHLDQGGGGRGREGVCERRMKGHTTMEEHQSPPKLPLHASLQHFCYIKADKGFFLPSHAPPTIPSTKL